MSALVTTNGVNKTQYETLSGSNLIATMNNVLGAACHVKLDTGKQGKKRLEWLLSAKPGSPHANGTWCIGVTDSATTVAGSGGSFIACNLGSTASKAGCQLIIKPGNTSVTPYRNGAQGSDVVLATAPDVNDRFALEFDTTANQVKFFHRPSGTGVWSAAFLTLTLSSLIPSGDWYGTCAGFTTSDALQIFLTGATQNGAPSSGFTAYDDSGGTALVIADCTSAGLATSITLNANPQVAGNNAASATVVANLSLNVNQPLGVFVPVSTAFAGNDSPGTEYAQNGAFNDASFWSIAAGSSSISAGKAQMPSANANSFEFKQNNALPNAGRWIKVQYTIGKWSGAPIGGSIRFRADTGAFGLDAPVLTALAPAASSLDWSSLYNNTVPWDSEDNSGDQVELEWRVNGGAWNVDTRQQMTGIYLAQYPTSANWPLFNAATFTTGQTVEVRERKFRYVANSVVGNSPYSNVLLFTVP